MKFAGILTIFFAVLPICSINGVFDRFHQTTQHFKERLALDPGSVQNDANEATLKSADQIFEDDQLMLDPKLWKLGICGDRKIDETQNDEICKHPVLHQIR